MAEITRNSTGLSGEYFVAAELLRRGFNVAITMGNAKAIDLIAEKRGKTFPIQVKSIYKKKNVGWPLLKSKIKPKHFYVFVNLNVDKLQEPVYLIIIIISNAGGLRLNKKNPVLSAGFFQGDLLWNSLL